MSFSCREASRGFFPSASSFPSSPTTKGGTVTRHTRQESSALARIILVPSSPACTLGHCATVGSPPSEKQGLGVVLGSELVVGPGIERLGWGILDGKGFDILLVLHLLLPIVASAKV